MISILTFPGTEALIQKTTSFEVFLSSERSDDIFSGMGKELAIEPSSSFGILKLPKSIFNSLKAKVLANGEFKIRLVKWTQDPFIFSDYHSVVCTNVLSIAILDSNGTELDFNITDPIIMLLPIVNQTLNYQDDFVQCMCFNDSNQINITSNTLYQIDVNFLNLTDREKKLLYPQWDPIAFQKTILS